MMAQNEQTTVERSTLEQQCLLEEQSSVEVMHQQIRGGRLVRRNNRKSASIEKRLHRLQERYDSGSLSATDFITGVSYNLTERH